MLQLINTFLLQPCQVGVGCEIVYSVDAKQLIGVFVFDQIGNAVFKISQIDQDQLLIVFREEGRDRMRKAVLYHDRCAALCVVVDYFGQEPETMKQAGIAYATSQIIDLYANGITNVHVYSMNKPDVAKAIMDNLSAILGKDFNR